MISDGCKHVVAVVLLSRERLCTAFQWNGRARAAAYRYGVDSASPEAPKRYGIIICHFSLLLIGEKWRVGLLSENLCKRA